MILRTIRSEPPFTEIRSLMRMETAEDSGFRLEVSGIIAHVVQGGDQALLELTERFDRYPVADPSALRIPAERLDAAISVIDADLLGSLERAAQNIERFHQRQVERGFLDLFPDGTVLGQRVTPLASVGVYVPGGRAAYPSTVLMNAVPARVAGVDRIAMVCPAPDGEISPTVLAAARIAGVHEVYTVGGAQAVAALAYGTETIAPVDKIVGPGNRWVAEAKRQVFGRVDIDMIAGPSEILVVADENADPVHVAADLISQAEHDPDSIAWLVTPDPRLPDAVRDAVALLLVANPRAEIARASLEANGLIVLVPDLDAAAAVADLRAPEHLELIVADPLGLAAKIRNAGAIFLGPNTPESVGDYFAGPNHVLPTGGTARWASPLGVYDFVKRTSLIGYSAERFAAHAADVVRLAESERLHGHAEAIRVRLSAHPS